eukprot:m.308770 g.308770  ORF g.308770 m.308770 type:complete len:205 (+) comp44752_c0_seq1:226-840(+)
MNFACCLVFLALVESSFAVICYKCSSSDNSTGTCNATVGSATATGNCTTEYCAASYSSAVYTRGCYNESVADNKTKFCQGDKCNGDYDKIVVKNETDPTDGPKTPGKTMTPTNKTTPAPTPLQCYTCNNSSDCSSTKTTCKITEKYCKTTLSGESVTGKSCEVTCTASTTANCCQTDLCNAGSTVNVGFLAILLALLAGFIVCD